MEAQKLERQLLLKSYSAPIPKLEPPHDNDEPAAVAGPVQQRHRSIHQSARSGLTEEDQQTVGASSSVTASLRRTHDLMASELGRSEFAHETLAELSAALRQLDDSYGSLDSMLGKSRELLGTLLRSQKSDTWYLQTAFYMLAVTGAWLVFRRLLYGPIWWLLLLPLRILLGVGSTATRAILPAGTSAPAQAGHATQQQSDEGRVPVQGIPHETLPTVKVEARDGDGEKQEEQVKEAVEEAVRQAVEEVEAAKQETSEAVEDRLADGEEAFAQEQGESDQVSTEDQATHAKDEL